MKKISLLVFGAVLFLSSCSDDPSTKASIKKTTKRTPNIAYTVDAVLAHSTSSFTEGLFVHEGQLIESTGSPEYFPETKSVYGVVDSNGTIQAVNELPKQYFGEGITVLNGKLYQLTYQSKKGFIWDFENGKKLGTFTIPAKEGWGFTNDGTHLIMSDGTENIRFLNPASLEVEKTIQVKENGRLVERINELEYVKGQLYANLFMTDLVLRIDPKTGEVNGKMDLSDLKRRALYEYPKSQETNGIAYDAELDLFYVTGKMWPYTFRIQLLD